MLSVIWPRVGWPRCPYQGHHLLLPIIMDFLLRQLKSKVGPAYPTVLDAPSQSWAPDVHVYMMSSEAHNENDSST